MDITNRCVAVADILGFRERVQAGSLQELAGLLDSLVNRTPKVAFHWSMAAFESGGKSRFLNGREVIHKLLFSDTLFLWSDPMPRHPDRYRARISGFLYGVAYILGAALLSGVPMRAGLACGAVLVDARKRIVIGQAVVDAYLTEGVQEWVGGALHESFPYLGHEICAVDYPVPTKSSSLFALTRALDWTMPVRVFDTEAPKGEKVLPKLERILEEGERNALSGVVRAKYANAAAFLFSRSVYSELARARALGYSGGSGPQHGD